MGGGTRRTRTVLVRLEVTSTRERMAALGGPVSRACRGVKETSFYSQ